MTERQWFDLLQLFFCIEGKDADQQIANALIESGMESEQAIALMRALLRLAQRQDTLLRAALSINSDPKVLSHDSRART
jgi:hypothetical protein